MELAKGLRHKTSIVNETLCTTLYSLMTFFFLLQLLSSEFFFDTFTTTILIWHLVWIIVTRYVKIMKWAHPWLSVRSMINSGQRSHFWPLHSLIRVLSVWGPRFSVCVEVNGIAFISAFIRYGNGSKHQYRHVHHMVQAQPYHLSNLFGRDNTCSPEWYSNLRAATLVQCSFLTCHSACSHSVSLRVQLTYMANTDRLHFKPV